MEITADSPCRDKPCNLSVAATFHFPSGSTTNRPAQNSTPRAQKTSKEGKNQAHVSSIHPCCSFAGIVRYNGAGHERVSMIVVSRRPIRGGGCTWAPSPEASARPRPLLPIRTSTRLTADLSAKQVKVEPAPTSNVLMVDSKEFEPYVG